MQIAMSRNKTIHLVYRQKDGQFRTRCNYEITEKWQRANHSCLDGPERLKYKRVCTCCYELAQDEWEALHAARLTACRRTGGSTGLRGLPAADDQPSSTGGD